MGGFARACANPAMTQSPRTFIGRLAAAALVLLLLIAAPHLAAAQSGELKGVITARDGDKMVVKSPDGAEHTFQITPSTKVVAIQGGLGLRSNDMAATDLLNGLPVTVESVTRGETAEASKVTFKQADLKTAQQIDAGTAQAKAQAKEKLTQAQNERDELKKRLSEANQYVAKGEATVYFKTGSIAIDAQGQSDLKDLCQKATAIKGYMIGVTGHADSTGDSQKNQVLSEKRANAVIRFMQKNCSIQPYRVLAQNAMGEDRPVAASAASAGSAASTGPEDKSRSRRVVVQILTNKGLEGL
jgi:outer membrane protein OmpA-like peptidoglycan-associated protein